jgi:hypothetical protein
MMDIYVDSWSIDAFVAAVISSSSSTGSSVVCSDLAGGRRRLLLLLVLAHLPAFAPEEGVEPDDDEQGPQHAADGDAGAEQQRVEHRGGHQGQRVEHGGVDGPSPRDGPGDEAEADARVEHPRVDDGDELQVPVQAPRGGPAAAGGGADEQRLRGAGDAGEHGGEVLAGELPAHPDLDDEPERVGQAAAAQVHGAQGHVVVRGDAGGGVVLEQVRRPRVQQPAPVEARHHGAADADGRAHHLHPPRPCPRRQPLQAEQHGDEEGHHGDEVEEVDGVGGGGGAEAVVVEPRGQDDPEQRADGQPAQHLEAHLAHHRPAAHRLPAHERQRERPLLLATATAS